MFNHSYQNLGLAMGQIQELLVLGFEGRDIQLIGEVALPDRGKRLGAGLSRALHLFEQVFHTLFGLSGNASTSIGARSGSGLVPILE